MKRPRLSFVWLFGFTAHEHSIYDYIWYVTQKLERWFWLTSGERWIKEKKLKPLQRSSFFYSSERHVFFAKPCIFCVTTLHKEATVIDYFEKNSRLLSLDIHLILQTWHPVTFSSFIDWKKNQKKKHLTGGRYYSRDGFESAIYSYWKEYLRTRLKHLKIGQNVWNIVFL
jgi:hypothetical protein